MTDIPAEPTAEVEELRVPCLCGCGWVPKHRTSRFMPGHDAQLKARLYRAIRDEQIPDQVRQEFLATLNQLGWPHPVPKPVKEEAPPTDVAPAV